MKVWFHLFHTEAHRRWQRGFELVRLLEAEGIEFTLHLDSTCDVALCGAFWCARDFDYMVHREKEARAGTDLRQLKTAHICWDLYEVHVRGQRQGMSHDEKIEWTRYVINLATATDLIIAPSDSAKDRMSRLSVMGHRIIDKNIVVIKAPCDPWWQHVQPDEVMDGGYVVDVMRKYDDFNQHLAFSTCQKLGIRCVCPGTLARPSEFQQLIRHARLLVSAYFEASTGGLTLLEGHALGKPVLLSSSHANGARDYFGERGNYFVWNNPDSFEVALRKLVADPPKLDAGECAAWVQANYSDEVYAKQLAAALKTLDAGGVA